MKKMISIAVLAVACLVLMADDGCDAPPAQSASGVSKASVQVPTGSDGLTAEQRNVHDRLLQDNKPGAIKHLYIISPSSGQVILYSTVKGKVTSSGKRLSPATVTTYRDNANQYGGFTVPIGGANQNTTEVLSDDGTYGSSG